MGYVLSGTVVCNTQFYCAVIQKARASMAVLIIIQLISIFVCYYVARRRKAKVMFWVLVSFVVGPLAIPFVFLSKPKNIIEQL